MSTGIGNEDDEQMSDGQFQLFRETYLSPMRDGNNFEERMKLAVYHTIVYVKGHGERSGLFLGAMRTCMPNTWHHHFSI